MNYYHIKNGEILHKDIDNGEVARLIDLNTDTICDSLEHLLTYIRLRDRQAKWYADSDVGITIRT